MSERRVGTSVFVAWPNSPRSIAPDADDGSANGTATTTNSPGLNSNAAKAHFLQIADDYRWWSLDPLHLSTGTANNNKWWPVAPSGPSGSPRNPRIRTGGGSSSSSGWRPPILCTTLTRVCVSERCEHCCRVPRTPREPPKLNRCWPRQIRREPALLTSLIIKAWIELGREASGCHASRHPAGQAAGARRTR